MKKVILSFMALAVMFVLTACGSNPSQAGEKSAGSAQSLSKQAQPSSELKRVSGGGKILVVYFSLPETADPRNMTREEENSTVVMDGKVLGNTQYVAQIIQEKTGADIFRIEPVTPYPLEHKTLVEQAKQEQKQAFRPAIKESVKNMDAYDTVFLGYPNWWGDMPMILYTFLESYDLSGKSVIPFNTHGGSGFSGTIGTIQDLQPNAVVNKNGFTVSRNDVHEAQPDIVAWLNKLGYTGQ